MSMFISVVNKHDENYYKIEKILIDLFGFNDCYWYSDHQGIKVYYKNVSDLEQILND